MPDTISLRAYLARLEEQLRLQATDEVVQHCRHVLQHYPKHVDTYRLLGRALLYKGRWDEASALFTRVLAVYPDDKVAHLGLAEIYGERNQGDRAIWHLERAFEHDPNNEELIASLRDLYKRFRSADYSKIQLTAGAIARQYGRNGLYDQAVDTLRYTLESHADRLDLRLLLAQMLWGAGQHIEAAEVALDVLEQLPDCLEANRILTRLWLLEDRPSDAQRYINSIEDVDPYAALELATGTEAPDAAFTLPELDYRRYAESMMAIDQPDWLQDIGDAEAPSVFSETSSQPQRLRSKVRPLDDEATLTELPEDWLSDTEIASLKPTTSLDRAREAAPDIELNFDDLVEDSSSVAARDLRLETSTHASIFSDREATGEVPQWLADSADDESASADAADEADDGDPLAWLRASGIELEDEDVNLDAPSAPASADEAEDSDPLAWLRDSGINIEDGDLAALTHEHPVVPAGTDEDSDDPMAWLRESGIELDDAPPEPTLLDPYETADDTPITDPDAADPLAWLRESGIEIDDVPPQPRLLDPYETLDDTPISDPDADDPLAWLRDSGIDIEDAPPAVVIPESSTTDTPLAAEAEDDPLDWMSNYGEDIVWNETPEPSTAAAPLEVPPAAPDAAYSWLFDSDEDAASEAVPQPEATPSAVMPADDDEDDFGWLQDENLLEEAPEADALTVDQDKISTGMLRRLASPAAAEEMTILESNSGEDDFASLQHDDWFVDVSGSAQVPAPQDAHAADRREAMSDKDSNLNPDWRDDDEFAAGNDQPAQPADDVPDWLAALGPSYAQPESLSRKEEPGASFNWSSDVEDADDAPSAGANASDSFAWMSELKDEDEAPVPQPEAGGAFSWSADLNDEDDVPPAQPNQADDMPDWLQSSVPPVLASSESTTRPDWLNDFEDQPQAEPAADAPLEADIPDWLSELQPPDATAPVASLRDDDEADAEFGWLDQMIQQEESQPIAPVPQSEVINPPVENEISWLPDFGDEAEDDMSAEAEPAVGLEMPDWLNTLTEPETVSPTESAEEVLDVETFAWESEFDEAEEAPAAEATPETGEPETFSWTNDIAATGPMQPMMDDTPSWLKEFEADAETFTSSAEEEATIVTVQPGEQPEWLSQAERVEDESLFEVEPEEASAAALDEFEFEMIEAQEAPLALSDTEHRPATNAPDWLNAMVPGVDLDYAPESDEAPESEREAPVSERRNQRDFEWLVDIVEEETQPASGPVAPSAPAEPEPEAPRFSFSKLPAWLRGKQVASKD
jgi:tetratricopeptide (TPR) repeat protein